MTDINSMKSMLNWKLLEGSHKFPGPDGGTCFNEAAIVAAGFEYKSVMHHRNLPECFDPLIGQHLIYVNDIMDSHHRQELIKYIPLMPGSKVADEKFEEYVLKFHDYIDNFITELFGEFYLLNLPNDVTEDVIYVRDLRKKYGWTKKAMALYDAYNHLLGIMFRRRGYIRIYVPENPPLYYRNEFEYVSQPPKIYTLREHFAPIIINQIDRLFNLNALYRKEAPIEVERVRDNINAFRKQHNLELI